ncbi:MAG: CPBP family intramembrane metalloprotease [Planctomycetes bacterium]|nr:CPBP family intramembrane metalloprotease [Planctomycetota bacterium]
MGLLSSQLSAANSVPTIESVPFFGNRLKHLDMRLLTETALITIAAVLAIKIFSDSWFMTPCILVSAALIPTVIKKSTLSEIGLSFGQTKHSLVVLGWTCLVVFPVMFCSLWLLKSYGLNLPLRPVLPQNQEWISWIFYQFMYVAVAEEVFFRGFLQGNILRLMKTMMARWPTQQCWVSIVISAACFAAAHMIVQGQIISVLTFLPGLVFGWLFIRTKSLLTPILFHGLANMSYYVMAGVFAA